jgi:hypothetical protein
MLFENLWIHLLNLSLLQGKGVPGLEAILLLGGRIAKALGTMGLENHEFESARMGRHILFQSMLRMGQTVAIVCLLGVLVVLG